MRVKNCEMAITRMYDMNNIIYCSIYILQEA